MRDRLGQRRQIGHRQIVPGIDPQLEAVGDQGGFLQIRQCLGRLFGIIVAAAIRAGIKLDTVAAGLLRRGELFFRGIRVAEQRHARSRRAQSRDDRLQHVAIGHEVPAMIGGRLLRVVGNQRDLLGLGLRHEVEEILGRIALDVELRPRKLVVDQRPDLGQIGEPDMALVGPRMHRQPVRASFQRDAAEAGDARPWQITPVT